MPSSPLHIAFITYAHRPNLTGDDALLAHHLRASGHRVETVPWDQSGSANELAAFDVAVLRSPWNYTDHYAQFCTWLDQLETQDVRLLNSIDTVRWNSDKIYLQNLSRNGHRIVETTLDRARREGRARRCLGPSGERPSGP